ncbi:MAG: hypothetical protein ABSA47_15305 [Verrucomicrobiota bacterium]|jgi:hypothetical protein
MGLTIHYTLSARHLTSGTEARGLVAQARVFARESKADSVSALMRVGPGFPRAREWLLIPHPGGETCVDVPLESGHVFTVVLGSDSEHLLLGLCRYPATVRHRGRELPTKLGEGWRLCSFCKTQYASLHGWEHFFRCHKTAIELLSFWRSLGVEVRISDEGGYWPRRSESALRRNLDEMNGIVAAMSGALKDGAGGQSVESPIFQHPQFERLEAEGAQKQSRKMRQALEVIGKIARET